VVQSGDVSHRSGESQQVGDVVVAAGGVAAVDGQGVTGDERGVGRQEERGDRRDLRRLGRSAEGVVADEVLADLVELGGAEAGAGQGVST
jgi:hypothetical protein